MSLFSEDSVTYVGNSGTICALYSAWLIYGIKTKKKIKLIKNEIETILIIIITSIIIPGISPLMHFSGLIAGTIFTGITLCIYFLKNKKTKAYVE